MTYPVLPDASFATDKPITGAQGLALRDRPHMIAAGEPGAPKIAVKTMSAGGSGTQTFAGLDAFAGVLVHGFAVSDGAARVFQFSVSDDGVTYYGLTTILTDTTPSTGESFVLSLDFDSGAYRIVGQVNEVPVHVTGTVAGASLAITHLRLIAPTSGTLAALVLPNGGESLS